MSPAPRPIGSDTEPPLQNELQPHQVAAVTDPRIPIRLLTGKGAANGPDDRAKS